MAKLEADADYQAKRKPEEALCRKLKDKLDVGEYVSYGHATAAYRRRAIESGIV